MTAVLSRSQCVSIVIMIMLYMLFCIPDQQCHMFACLPNLVRRFGVHPARRFYDIYGGHVERKLGNADLTFKQVWFRTTSWYGRDFRITDPLWAESTGVTDIFSSQRVSNVELWWCNQKSSCRWFNIHDAHVTSHSGFSTYCAISSVISVEYDNLRNIVWLIKHYEYWLIRCAFFIIWFF